MGTSATVAEADKIPSADKDQEMGTSADVSESDKIPSTDKANETVSSTLDATKTEAELVPTDEGSAPPSPKRIRTC